MSQLVRYSFVSPSKKTFKSFVHLVFFFIFAVGVITLLLCIRKNNLKLYNMKLNYYLCRSLVFLLIMFGISMSLYGVTIEVKTEGSLEQAIADCDAPSLQELKIVGRINSVDIAYLRTNEGRLANIEKLDLNDVIIVIDGGAYANLTYSDNSVTMDNYCITFYLSDENRKEVLKSSNMMGGRDYTISYYTNNLAGAFANMNYECIIMPKDMKEVGIMTFYHCANLTEVDFSNSVEIIEEFSFERCVSLVDLDLSKVRKLGKSAFSGCTNFRSTADSTVYLSSLDTIPDNVFGYPSTDYIYCESIKNIVLSNKLRHIGESAFSYCKKLQAADLPEGLETIGNYAFGYCDNLSSVNIPSTVRSLNRTMFDRTPFINSLPVEDKVVYLRTTALCYKRTDYQYSNISLTIREGTTEIGDLFAGDYNDIVNVSLPSSIRRIGSSAFSNCRSLKNINLPEGLEEIADGFNGGVFEYCKNLSGITFPSTLKKIGSRAFNYCQELEFLELPEHLEVIGYYAFRNCSKITSLTLPESVKIIGEEAFYGCPITGEVTIPKGVEQLGANILSGLSRINYLAENATHMESASYGGTIFSAENIYIGANVRQLPHNAFSYSSDIKNVVFEERTDKSELVIGPNCFTGISIETLNLPKGKIEICLGAFAYSTISSIEVQGVVTKMGEDYNPSMGWTSGAFSGIESLKEVSFPDGLTHVGYGSFSGCSNLASVNLGNSVRSIGERAFEGCALTGNIHLGEHLESIGESAFYECGFSTFKIPESVKSIGSSAFCQCLSLTEIDIPNTVEIVSDRMFYNCKALKRVHLPEGVKEIGEFAFYDCDFEEIVIPSTVTKIGKDFLGFTKSGWDRNLRIIESHILNPWEIPTQYRIFRQEDFSIASLRVPAGTLQAYQDTKPWNQFKRIREIGCENPDNTLTAEGFKIPTGRNRLLSIFLNNQTTDYTAFQFDIALPNNLIINEENSKTGAYVVRKGYRFGDINQKLIVKDSGYDRYTIESKSSSNSFIKGTEGELLTISLHAHETTELGECAAYLEGIVFTRVDGTKHELYDVKIPITLIDGSDIYSGDTNNDGVVDVSDAVAAINYILEKSTGVFELYAADTNNDGEVDVFDIIKMIDIILSNSKNTAPRRVVAPEPVLENIILMTEGNGIWMGIEHPERFTAFQFNVKVPDGAELKALEYTEALGHQLLFAKSGDNLYTVVGFSMNNEKLSIKNDKLIKMCLYGNTDGEVLVSNIKFVTPEEEIVRFNDGTLSITTNISGIATEQYDKEIYDMFGRKLINDQRHLGHGVYIVGGKKIVIK